MISIITRLGSEGIKNFDRIFLCLEMQTDLRFEWCIVLRPSVESFKSEFENQIARSFVLQNRSKIVIGGTDNRSSLLNQSFNSLSGDYFVVLDDDDIALMNMVQSFMSALSDLGSPAILRAIGGIRNIDSKWLEATTSVTFPWPHKFKITDHLRANQSPTFILAFPTNLVKIDGIYWNMDLDVVEDWDFLMRSIALYPVVSIPDIVGIYQREDGHYRSKSVTSESQWRLAEKTVRNYLNSKTYLNSINENRRRRRFRASIILVNLESKIISILSISPPFFRLAKLVRKFFRRY